MCYPAGSVNHALKDCPMCRIFPHTDCPHRRELCRNRNVHPRFDVLFFKNAEVESFNGCGWCKWANFRQQEPVINNNGWPGCCRPPQDSELKMISAVDWRAVNVVFNVPIPSDVKHVLDAFAPTSPTSRRGTPPPTKSSSPVNGDATTPPRPTTSSRANSFSRERIPAATVGPSTCKGSRSSPKQNVTGLNSGRSNGSASSSPKSPSTLEMHHGHRQRQPIPDFGEGTVKEKKSEGAKSTQSSPSNVNKSLNGDIPAPSPGRVSTIRRNSAASSSAGAPTRNGKAQDGSVRRRSPTSSSPASRSTALSATSGRSDHQQSSKPCPKQTSPISVALSRPPKPMEDDSRSSSGSSDGLGGGSGSLSDSTITSDGGFTDYLSDESEAELQRQAEARAALLAQNQLEEMEFKAVRQRLAQVDLRPPKSWNPTNITNTGSLRLAAGSKG